MVTTCCVFGCRNRFDIRRDRSKKGTRPRRFYRFPSPRSQCHDNRTRLVATIRRLYWLNNVAHPYYTLDAIPAHARVCSDHFILGKPSTLFEFYKYDWAPTLLLPQNHTDHTSHDSLKDLITAGKRMIEEHRLPDLKTNETDPIQVKQERLDESQEVPEFILSTEVDEAFGVQVPGNSSTSTSFLKGLVEAPNNTSSPMGPNNNCRPTTVVLSTGVPSQIQKGSRDHLALNSSSENMFRNVQMKLPRSPDPQKVILVQIRKQHRTAQGTKQSNSLLRTREARLLSKPVRINSVASPSSSATNAHLDFKVYSNSEYDTVPSKETTNPKDYSKIYPIAPQEGVEDLLDFEVCSEDDGYDIRHTNDQQTLSKTISSGQRAENPTSTWHNAANETSNASDSDTDLEDPREDRQHGLEHLRRSSRKSDNQEETAEENVLSPEDAMVVQELSEDRLYCPEFDMTLTTESGTQTQVVTQCCVSTQTEHTCCSIMQNLIRGLKEEMKLLREEVSGIRADLGARIT